jgi:hypothetical protein
MPNHFHFERKLTKIFEMFGRRSDRKNASRAKAQRAPRFGEISNDLSLRAWRPFDSAQDMLGAINLVEDLKGKNWACPHYD